MPKKVIPRFKQGAPQNFIQSWMDDKGYTLDDLQNRIATMFEADVDISTISRWVNGGTSIDVQVLWMLADILETTPQALMSRPPGIEPNIREIYESIAPDKQEQAVETLKSFVKKAS
jgi:transcriptional regulator with XRE-family HTH domain